MQSVPSCSDCKYHITLYKRDSGFSCCSRVMRRFRQYDDKEHTLKYSATDEQVQVYKIKCKEQRTDSRGFFGFFRDTTRCGLDGKYYSKEVK